jgi:hypothetical protein
MEQKLSFHNRSEFLLSAQSAVNVQPTTSHRYRWLAFAAAVAAAVMDLLDEPPSRPVRDGRRLATASVGGA